MAADIFEEENIYTRLIIWKFQVTMLCSFFQDIKLQVFFNLINVMETSANPTKSS